ncbi:hypothetical protein N7468_003386 [Penicillium chermesinum]|uniref:Zn(2)-C6 fungal-type domain-containing protein n=1 Tax=Penicillium chermesinum TaxID=63820 RepID=A0A9W9P951_9EURO|nr:uncharacterized protein N7468_003386 [Penicillium chermesinum]KAJ5238767.1 hypothetical protein N7468_003386 [Penicillium chermesinum]
MVGENGRQVLVCINCKLRKKKCDKVQPQCGYCTRKKLACRYQSSTDAPLNVVQRPDPTASSPLIQSSLLLSSTLSEVLASEPKTTDSMVYLQVLRIIRATGQYVDDVTARYFRGIHSFVLVISRPRFYDQLIKSEAPPPGFSILLLSMCLITDHVDLRPRDAGTIDQETLYLATKTLFAHVQASSSPSLHLIQAGIIVASYEYSSERLQEAFATVAVCARLGYAIGLNKAKPARGMDQSSYQQAEEEANTWWGILITERTVLCELSDFTIPLSTSMPSADAQLPSDPSTTDPLDDAGGFACVAQGALLLDQVISAFQIADADARLNRLNGLHHALRTVLGTVLEQSNHAMGAYCTANSLLIRTMYLLHWHILHHASRMTTFKYKSQEEWCRSSSAALDTATKMVEDIAVSQNIYSFHMMDGLPSSCRYLLRAAIEHIDREYADADAGIWNRGQIQTSLHKFDYRWGR